MKDYRLLTAVGALFYIAIGISSPLITLYLESLGADYFQISLILTTYVIMVLVGNYIWGRLSDRLGRRKPLLIAGLLGVGIAYALISQAPTALWAWPVRLVEGFFLAAYSTLALALMGDLLDLEEGRRIRAGLSSQKGRRMGIYRGIGSLAFAGGAMIGGRLADAYSLSAALTLCAALYVVAALLALWLHDVDTSDLAAFATAQQQETASSGRSMPLARLPYLFLGGVMLWTAAHSASASMWPNYMSQLGYTKTAISSLWGLAALVEMPSMVVAGALSDSFGRAVMLAAGSFGITIVNLGYLFFATLLPALLVIQVIRGFGFGSYTATAMTFTAETGAQHTRGSNSGVFFMASSAGQLAGMFLGGAVAQAAGFHILYAMCATFALLSGVCFLLLRAQTARATKTPVVA